jgi:hypothetical protein
MRFLPSRGNIWGEFVGNTSQINPKTNQFWIGFKLQMKSTYSLIQLTSSRGAGMVESQPGVKLKVFWIRRIIKVTAVVVVLTLLMGASTLTQGDFADRVRAYTRQVEFDYVSWTINALAIKWQQMALGSGEYVPQADQSQIVLQYLDLVRQIGDLEGQVTQIYADPEVRDPQAASQKLRAEISQLHIRRDLLGPLAETVLQAQLTEVLSELGVSLGGQPIPPVMYHITPPPSALIVSPRNVIRQDANISINPDMTLEQITQLEDQVADGLDVSTLVVGIGGVGLYPTMVMQTTDINWLAEVVAHEWTHNFLTLRPLGASYLNSPELRSMNETTASLAGKEVGRALIAKYYPEYLPPPPQPEPENPNPRPGEPPVFDFRGEMRITRMHVDELLAQGRVDEAESYMELRRRFFWENGYHLRKLNQAYFAFYGAYADQPGGAAGADPVGAAVRELRANSPDLATFLNRISWVWTFDQLQQMVQQVDQPPAGS